MIPKYLGAQGFGQYAFLITIAALVGSVVSLGMPNYLVRRIAVSPARAMAEGGAAVVLATGVALIMAIGLCLILPAIGYSATDPNFLKLALATMVVSAAQNTIFSTLNGQGRHARFAWLNVVGVVTGTTATVAVLVAGWGLGGVWVASLLVSGAITAIGWQLTGFRLQRTFFDLSLWLKLAKSGLPFLGGNLALQIRSQIVFIVTGLLLPAQVVGSFAAAYRIIAIPVFIPTAVIIPLLPVLSRNVDRPEEFKQTLRRSLTTVLLLIVPASAMILALAPAIPDLFHWGPSFYTSVSLMRILAFQQPLVAVDMVLGTALIALHKERRMLRIAIAGAIFNPAMNFLLIPFFEQLSGSGVMVAAVIEVATECLFLVWSISLLPRGLLDRATVSAVARVFAAGVGLALVAVILLPLSLPLAVLGGTLAYGGLILLSGVFRFGDVRRLQQLVLASRGAA